MINDLKSYLNKKYNIYDRYLYIKNESLPVIVNKMPKQLKFIFDDNRRLQIDHQWLDVLNLVDSYSIKEIIESTIFSSLPADFFNEFQYAPINDVTLNYINHTMETLSRNSESIHEKSLHQRILSNLGY